VDDDLREVLSNASRYEPAARRRRRDPRRGSTGGRIAEAERSTLEGPGDGATVVYRVDALADWPAEDRNHD
jgi:hypothetical protein